MFSGDAPANEGPRPSAIDEQRQAAEAERTRLTYELGHRVKNTLSMVQALANQTLRGAPDPDAALEAFSERITAMARANDAILAESWTTATLGAVATSVLTSHGHAKGPLDLEGPEWRLPAGAALSFAMALHELATNAKRHGAWSVPRGHVSLTWGAARAEGEPVNRLCWQESGGPPAGTPAPRGFGLRFAERSLKSAFGRDVVLAFEPAGLRCLATWRPEAAPAHAPA